MVSETSGQSVRRALPSTSWIVFNATAVIDWQRPPSSGDVFITQAKTYETFLFIFFFWEGRGGGLINICI